MNTTKARVLFVLVMCAHYLAAAMLMACVSGVFPLMRYLIGFCISILWGLAVFELCKKIFSNARFKRILAEYPEGKFTQVSVLLSCFGWLVGSVVAIYLFLLTPAEGTGMGILISCILGFGYGGCIGSVFGSQFGDFLLNRYYGKKPSSRAQEKSALCLGLAIGFSLGLVIFFSAGGLGLSTMYLLTMLALLMGYVVAICLILSVIKLCGL